MQMRRKTRMRQSRTRVAVTTVVAALSLMGLVGCSPDAPCRTPDECTCPSPSSGDSSLVILTDEASPAFSAAISRLTVPEATAYDAGLGLSGMPTVTLATYNATGEVTEVGSFDLNGTGDTRTRKEASTELAAACFAEAAATVPTSAPDGNLLRALPAAAELAATRGPHEAAILAVGLGRSSLDDPTMEENLPLDGIDLTTAGAREHVADVLRSIGLLPINKGVSVTLLNPDESVINTMTAGDINHFAEHELCDAIGIERCQVLEVLP